MNLLPDCDIVLVKECIFCACEMSKNKIAFATLFTTTLLTLINGNIFTDPTKLARLFELQMRLSKILPDISDEELVVVPQDILLGMVR